MFLYSTVSTLNPVNNYEYLLNHSDHIVEKTKIENNKSETKIWEKKSFFLFFIDKEKLYIKKRGDTKNNALRSIQEVYNRSQKAQTKGGRIETKNIICPYLKPNQSIKLTSEKGLKSMDTLNPRP